VYVQSVESGSAAEAAGLQVGDLFVSIDGTAISATSDITSILNDLAVGDTIEIQVVRGKQILALSLTLQESKPSTATSKG
jgi:serine protease Do